MKSGVRKSGWPMPRLMMSRPCAIRALARASTAKAFSSPMRSKAAIVFNMASLPGDGPHRQDRRPRSRFDAQFTRLVRENQIGLSAPPSVVAAIVGAEVALNLEADVRVGVVAEVIIAIIDWASWEKVCAPVPCLHANGGMGRHLLLVLARLGGVGRRSGCKNQGERDDGHHQLDRKRCHGCILSSSRRSLPYPTSAAAQGRMVVHSITTRCRNIRGRQGLDALQTLSRRHWGLTGMNGAHGCITEWHCPRARKRGTVAAVSFPGFFHGQHVDDRKTQRLPPPA